MNRERGGEKRGTMIGKAAFRQLVYNTCRQTRRMYISLFVFSLVVPKMGNDICRFTAAARKYCTVHMCYAGKRDEIAYVSLFRISVWQDG